MSHENLPTYQSHSIDSTGIRSVRHHPHRSRTVIESANHSAISAKRIGSVIPLIRPRNRFFRLSVGLGLMMIVACMTVIDYSHLFLATDGRSSLGLMYCDSVPCFRGIVPGQTNWADAIVAFNGHSTINGDPYYGRIILFPSASGSVPGSILIDHPLDHPLTVGQIIDFYGPPSCVTINRLTGTLILHYAMLHVLARSVGNHISPDTPVSVIVIGGVGAGSNQIEKLCSRAHLTTDDGQTSYRSWHGFMSIQSYLRKKY